MTHRGGLGTVKDGYVRIVNASDKSKPELFRGSFDQAGPRSAILICKLFRAGAKWKLFTMMEPSYGTFYEQMIPAKLSDYQSILGQLPEHTQTSIHLRIKVRSNSQKLLFLAFIYLAVVKFDWNCSIGP